VREYPAININIVKGGESSKKEPSRASENRTSFFHDTQAPKAVKNADRMFDSFVEDELHPILGRKSIGMYAA
jgi:hypothetical protein